MSDDAVEMLLHGIQEDRERLQRTLETVVRIEADIRAVRDDIARAVKRADEHDARAASLAARLSSVEGKAEGWDYTVGMARKGAGTLFLLFLGSLWAVVARNPHQTDAHDQVRGEPPAEIRPR